MIANSLYGYVEGLTDSIPPPLGQVKRTTYKLVWEARNGRDEERLDLLIRNGYAVRLCFELLIGRDQKALDELVQRARRYAAQHKCKVWVVSFCLDDCGEPKGQLRLPKTSCRSKVEHM